MGSSSPQVASELWPGWLCTCSGSQDLPISGRASGVPRGWVKGESPHFGAILHSLALPASQQGHPASTVCQAAALPHAHPCCHHPIFLDLLASLMLGGSASTRGLAALRDWHWFGASLVYLGPCWTQHLVVVLWVGWSCSYMGPVLVLDMKWLSETSALSPQG